jgi:hypothetical protein
MVIERDKPNSLKEPAMRIEGEILTSRQAP